MGTLNFQTEQFEGPLDLMLHLISKHKLNITDIPIASLLSQYLLYLEEMRQADMEVASEFLEMASRLVYIKTVSLLPKYEDEAEELQRELSGRLLEYSLIKQAAAELSSCYIGMNLFVRQPAELDCDKTYRLSHDKAMLQLSLLESAGKLQRKLPPPAEAFSGIVTRRIVSVLSKTILILRDLVKNKKAKIFSFYEKSADRSDLVATFLAVLELVKSKRVLVTDDDELLLNSQVSPYIHGAENPDNFN